MSLDDFSVHEIMLTFIVDNKLKSTRSDGMIRILWGILLYGFMKDKFLF